MQAAKFKIAGMTCSACVETVTKHLKNIKDVSKVDVSLTNEAVKIKMLESVPIHVLQQALPENYILSEQLENVDTTGQEKEKTDLQQLFPLFLVFFYITVTSLVLNRYTGTVSGFMLDFMGIFYIVFSFFKFLDYKNFPGVFGMYDPLARVFPIYGWVYPFIETGLGLLFLFRIELKIALISTLIILGATTIGVVRTMISKSTIQCACLGTALRLPMTKATLIENGIMLIMAVWM
ncbi:MAG: MauE/DoxX family redox-associated membrane protein, partial [Candidatus Neomarinimicrobiota bacterium]|nr:MauE/DoxX family redox-associated membrane protein [Candidatus Neomarinimicrobiota bacterium]